MATIRMPGASPQTVVAQDPPPDAKNVLSPKIALVVASNDSSQAYVMPSFVERPMADVSTAIQQAGFILGKVELVQDVSGVSGTVLRQFPPAGQKIAAGGTISFIVRK